MAHVKHDENRERDVGGDKGCSVPVTREEDCETVRNADEAHHQKCEVCRVGLEWTLERNVVNAVVF